jgi:hypothetical protein
VKHGSFSFSQIAILKMDQGALKHSLICSSTTAVMRVIGSEASDFTNLQQGHGKAAGNQEAKAPKCVVFKDWLSILLCIICDV